MFRIGQPHVSWLFVLPLSVALEVQCPDCTSVFRSELKKHTDGRCTVLCPGDEGFWRASSVWNAIKGKARPDPCVVAQPEDEGAVLSLLEVAHRNGWTFGVKNGGHHPAGWAKAGQVLIDLKALRGIHVVEGRRSVRVAAGERWGSVYEKVTDHGLVVHGAADFQVGVTGSTLVGGITFLSRTRGLISHGLLGARMALANGTVVVLNPRSPPPLQDFFEMLRAGSGFAALPAGIITELEFSVFVPEPQYLGAMISGFYNVQNAIRMAEDIGMLWTKKLQIPDQRLDVALTVAFRNSSADDLCQLNVFVFYDGAASAGLAAAKPILNTLRELNFLLDRDEDLLVDSYKEFLELSQVGDKEGDRIAGLHGSFVHADHVPTAVSEVIGALSFDNAGSGQFLLMVEDRVSPDGTARTPRATPDTDPSWSTALVSLMAIAADSSPKELSLTAKMHEKLLKTQLQPLEVAEYLGYLSQPSPERLRMSLRPSGNQGTYEALRCWRGRLGAARLVNGVGTPEDDAVWRQRQEELRQATGASNVSPHAACPPDVLPFSKGNCKSLVTERRRPLSGSTALIVGATGGIGQEVALQISALGAAVSLTSRSVKRCRRVAHKVWVLYGSSPECRALDLRNKSGVIEFAASQSKPFDVVVVSAAYNGEDRDKQAWQSALWVNHLGPLLLLQELFDHSLLHSTARVVFLSSGAADFASWANAAWNQQIHHAFADYAKTKLLSAQSVSVLARYFHGSEREGHNPSVRLVVPPITVNTSLTKHLLPELPSWLRSELRFGPAAVAALSVVAATLPDAPTKYLGEKQANVGQVLRCFGGCSATQCPVPSDTVHACDAWRRSQELLERPDDQCSGQRHTDPLQLAYIAWNPAVLCPLMLLGAVGVALFMPLYTISCVQAATAEPLTEIVYRLYNEEGLGRFYYGFYPALIISCGLKCSTQVIDMVLIGLRHDHSLQLSTVQLAAIVLHAILGFCLTPLDSLLARLQVSGGHSQCMRERMKHGDFVCLRGGRLWTIVAALRELTRQVLLQGGTFQNQHQPVFSSALYGIMAAAISDLGANGLRVLKVRRQTQVVSYEDAADVILASGGFWSIWLGVAPQVVAQLLQVGFIEALSCIWS